MTWLSRISLVQRGLIALMAVVAVAFGAIAIPQLKQQLLPSIDLPMVSVIAPYQGASPDVVEKQVVEPLEDGIQGVDGVTGVTATASEGSAVVMAQFDYGDRSEQVASDIEKAVNRARAQLPEGVDPQVVSGGTDDIPTVVLAATSETKDQQALGKALDTAVVPELKEIDGVGQVTVDGVQDQVVAVTPDDAELARAQLTPADLSKALEAGGASMPAGAFNEDGKNRTVQVGSGFGSLKEIEQLQVPGEDGDTVAVGDVASVRQVSDTATSLTRTNGERSLSVAMTMDNDASAVGISESVEEKLPELQQALGAGAHLSVVADQGPQVSTSIESLTTEGLLGLVFAVVVILIFLLSLRSTLVTAVSIPLSVLLTLIVLWTQDLSLNMLTLGALTIAIGRVVDDSIVVLENIKRHLGYGKERQRAILDAVKEVSGAITSSTLTTVAVFLPMAFVGGMVGALFGGFSLTITVALLASLVVSLTVVPVLSYWFLRVPASHRGLSPEEQQVKAEEQEARSRLQRIYVPVLRFATRRRVTSLVIAVAVLLGTFGMAPLLKTNFFDQGEQQQLTVDQELAPGTSLSAADRQAKKIEKLLKGLDGVEEYQVTVGSSGIMAAFGGGTDTNHASYQVKLDEDADADALQDGIRDGLDGLGSSAGETKVAAGDGFSGQDLSVVVKAGERDALTKASEQVRKEVAGLDGVTDVTSDLAQSVPRVSVTAKDSAARFGLNDAALGQAVAQAIGGTKSGTAVLEDTERDIMVRSSEPATTVAELKKLPVGKAKLGDVAEVRTVEGPVQMTRIDGARAATITAKPTAENTGQVATELQSAVDGLDLPNGASAEIGGLSQDQDEAFASLGLAMLAAIAIVFMLLVATFRSLIQPLILLVSIPFAATGAVGLLVATGTPMGVPAMIGMLMLIGIVVTNAIVLIDLVNQYRDRGYGVIEAVIEGGRHRLRPILMTALATICALTPMALAVTGDGGFISQPLAVVVIGGLITSTLLTLLLVPTLYAMVELRKERRAAKKAAKRAGSEPGSGEGGGGQGPSDGGPEGGPDEQPREPQPAGAGSA
ncbi:efflux RND transporter permease subunit [Streptomyces xiaopingdaonensis]|uniref:efflux RND transporter permease subunit n=1 Tax=Streptomyces xiaopingdaonensis TaxID=1565415 RepID=UPI000312F9D1|nr:efflux RND transporter permease subunit [Streptomyces xiaopingdaonensis]